MSETLSKNEVKNYKDTHVAIQWDPKKDEPMRDLDRMNIEFYATLKDATDMVEEEIKKNPAMMFRIFQLRTIIEGVVKMERKDFNS